MNWSKCQQNMLPYVFSIETPQGSGTGVFFTYNRHKTMVAIATAAHVVEHAEDWKEPIRIRQHTTSKVRFLQDSDRVIFIDRKRDSASILIQNNGFDLPTKCCQ